LVNGERVWPEMENLAVRGESEKIKVKEKQQNW